jgi:hypothetical protein
MIYFPALVFRIINRLSTQYSFATTSRARINTNAYKYCILNFGKAT